MTVANAGKHITYDKTDIRKRLMTIIAAENSNLIVTNDTEHNTTM